MLHMFFDGMQAYAQIGTFLGALICLGLGGLLLGTSLYHRLHSFRADGTIVGVTQNSGSYFPVYRYTLPDGRVHEAKSDTGSSSPLNMDTGRAVPLLVSPNNPDQAQPANSHAFDILGVLLVAPGIWLGYLAFTAFPVTRMTWIMAALLLLYAAERLHRIIIPKGQRPSLADWRQQHDLGPVDMSNVKPAENLANLPEARAALQTQTRNGRKAAPFIALLLAILIGVGIFESVKIGQLQSRGISTDGVVVRLAEESGSHNTYNYYAIVHFQAPDRGTVQFKDNVGSNPPSHRRGDRVTVLYMANDPGRQVMIDRGPLLNWAIPLIIFLFAGFLAWLYSSLTRRTTDSAPT